jgi:hypothetical protein
MQAGNLRRSNQTCAPREPARARSVPCPHRVGRDVAVIRLGSGQGEVGRGLPMDTDGGRDAHVEALGQAQHWNVEISVTHLLIRAVSANARMHLRITTSSPLRITTSSADAFSHRDK